MNGAIARVILRYLSGILIALGFQDLPVDDLSVDADFVFIAEATVGLFIGIIAEVWWKLAKKFGWET